MIREWLNRTWFMDRYKIGPRLTNFGALIVLLLLAVVVAGGVWLAV